MTSSEKKKESLITAKNQMNPNGGKTGEVSNAVSSISSFFNSFIKSDNINYYNYVVSPLNVVIESNGDFINAVDYINRAIAMTQNDIDKEAEEKEKE